MSTTDEPGRLESQAEALIDLGRHEQALAVLAQALALDAHALEPHLLRARSLLALERYDEARHAAGAAIAIAPESSHAHRLLALTQLKGGSSKAAKRTALEAVGLDPDEAFNYVVLGESLQATGDEAGALAAAHHAIELAPESSIGHDLEGRLLLAHEEIAGAESAFRRGLALDPESDALLNNLAIVLARQGRHDDAVAGLEAAARVDPTDQLVRRNVLRVARGQPSWLRGVGVVLALLGVLVVLVGVADDSVGSMIVGGAMIVLAAAAFEWGIRRTYRRLAGPTGQLLRDDHRARRFKPWRWDWSWITRLRPWWWLILERIPPPIALLLNVAAAFAVPLLALGVPFSAWRAWRWFRRRHPGGGSWRLPAGGPGTGREGG